MDRAMLPREIRRNLGIGIGIAGTSRPLCAVHRPDRRMRPERRRIGGAFQATIDPLYRQCGRRPVPHLHPPSPCPPPAAPRPRPACRRLFERSFCRDFAFRLSRSLLAVYRLIARASLQRLCFSPWRIKGRRCADRARPRWSLCSVNSQGVSILCDN